MLRMLFALNLASASLATLDVSKGKFDNIEQIFDVDFAGEKNGGCKDFEASIEKSFRESLEIVSQASESLEWLSALNEMPTAAAKDDHAKYTKISEVYKLLLGNQDAWKDNGPNPGVTAARETFAQYLNSHRVEESAPVKKLPEYHLRCGDHWLKYLAADSKDPREEGKPDAEKYTIGKPRAGRDRFPNGAMLAPGMPEELQLIYLEREPEDPTTPWCRKNVKAVSIRRNKLLILCSNTYMTPPTFGTRNKHDFPNQETDIDEGDSLDIVDTVPAVTWVHEMGHYVMGWREPKAFNPHSRKDELVYDLDMAVSLSKSYRDGPMPWPENLALFAAAVHLNQWYWGSGKAARKSGAGTHDDGNVHTKMGSIAQEPKGPTRHARMLVA